MALTGVVQEELAVGGPKALPAFQAELKGLSVTTIEVPSVQNKAGWNSFLHMVSVADGMVILRPSDTCDMDEDGYLTNSDMMSQLAEVADCRPTLIVCVVKGPLRGNMLFCAGIAQLVLATHDATFGLPQGLQVHPAVGVALKRRLTDATRNRLQLVGDTLSSCEAQRFGLCDFVGDDETVENEVCRLIYRNCSPQTHYFAEKSDMVKALNEQEATEDAN